jgi:hypothetical protein
MATCAKLMRAVAKLKIDRGQAMTPTASATGAAMPASTTASITGMAALASPSMSLSATWTSFQSSLLLVLLFYGKKRTCQRLRMSI